jgi:hypothetical protein
MKEEKLVIGSLRGQSCFFARTLEQAFGNGPAITGGRVRRRDRTDWGGNYQRGSYRIPPAAWLGAAVFVLVLFVLVPHVGHVAGLQ